MASFFCVLSFFCVQDFFGILVILKKLSSSVQSCLTLILFLIQFRRAATVTQPEHIMKADLHPKYNPVVFVDITTGRRFITRSTVTSAKTEVIDGVEHYVVSCGITSDSHPFFTGKNQFVDTEGRIDKFQKRFGSVRRAKKPTLG